MYDQYFHFYGQYKNKYSSDTHYFVRCKTQLCKSFCTLDIEAAFPATGMWGRDRSWWAPGARGVPPAQQRSPQRRHHLDFQGESSTVSPGLEAKANVLLPLAEFLRSHMNYSELFICAAFCDGWFSASFVFTLTASSFFSDLLSIKKPTICLEKPKREL